MGQLFRVPWDIADQNHSSSKREHDPLGEASLVVSLQRASEQGQCPVAEAADWGRGWAQRAEVAKAVFLRSSMICETQRLTGCSATPERNQGDSHLEEQLQQRLLQLKQGGRATAANYALALG